MPMLRSKFITTAASERTTVRERGDLLLVESPTAEEALDRLSSLLGPDVEIIAANKVARGGGGGFFAREVVPLTPRAPPRPPRPRRGSPSRSRQPLEPPLNRLRRSRPISERCCPSGWASRPRLR